MQTSVKIEGISQLQRQFAQLGVESTELGDALREASADTFEEAVVDTPYLTGLGQSTMRLAGGKTKAAVRAGGRAVDYLRYLHSGTSTITANPWIQDAIDKNSGEIVTELEKQIQQILDTYK